MPGLGQGLIRPITTPQEVTPSSHAGRTVVCPIHLELAVMAAGNKHAGNHVGIRSLDNRRDSLANDSGGVRHCLLGIHGRPPALARRQLADKFLEMDVRSSAAQAIFIKPRFGRILLNVVFRPVDLEGKDHLAVRRLAGKFLKQAVHAVGVDVPGIVPDGIHAGRVNRTRSVAARVAGQVKAERLQGDAGLLFEQRIVAIVGNRPIVHDGWGRLAIAQQNRPAVHLPDLGCLRYPLGCNLPSLFRRKKFWRHDRAGSEAAPGCCREFQVINPERGWIPQHQHVRRVEFRRCRPPTHDNALVPDIWRSIARQTLRSLAMTAVNADVIAMQRSGRRAHPQHNG